MTYLREGQMYRVYFTKSFGLLIAITAFLQFSITTVVSGGLDGWEVDSEYNRLYNLKDRDQIKGDIIKFIKVLPLPGMAPGTALVLDEGDGKGLVVHIGPESFSTKREFGFRRGDWVKIRGVWADINNETVFIAAKIKKDNGYSYKVRLTSDGTPFWTLSAEQLEYERKDQ